MYAQSELVHILTVGTERVGTVLKSCRQGRVEGGSSCGSSEGSRGNGERSLKESAD